MLRLAVTLMSVLARLYWGEKLTERQFEVRHGWKHGASCVLSSEEELQVQVRVPMCT